MAEIDELYREYRRYSFDDEILPNTKAQLRMMYELYRNRTFDLIKGWESIYGIDLLCYMLDLPASNFWTQEYKSDAQWKHIANAEEWLSEFNRVY